MASLTHIRYHVDGSKTLHRRAKKQGRREAIAKKLRANISLDAELMNAKKEWRKRTGYTFSRWVQLQMLKVLYMESTH